MIWERSGFVAALFALVMLCACSAASDPRPDAGPVPSGAKKTDSPQPPPTTSKLDPSSTMIAEPSAQKTSSTPKGRPMDPLPVSADRPTALPLDRKAPSAFQTATFGLG